MFPAVRRTSLNRDLNTLILPKTLGLIAVGHSHIAKPLLRARASPSLDGLVAHGVYKDGHNRIVHVAKRKPPRCLIAPDGRYIAGASVDSQKLMLFDFSTRKWRV